MRRPARRCAPCAWVHSAPPRRCTPAAQSQEVARIDRALADMHASRRSQWEARVTELGEGITLMQEEQKELVRGGGGRSLWLQRLR